MLWCRAPKYSPITRALQALQFTLASAQRESCTNRPVVPAGEPVHAMTATICCDQSNTWIMTAIHRQGWHTGVGLAHRQVAYGMESGEHMGSSNALKQSRGTSTYKACSDTMDPQRCARVHASCTVRIPNCCSSRPHCCSRSMGQ